MRYLFSTLLIGMLTISAASRSEQRVALFQAGAAKIDITPPSSELPQGYLGVLDPLFARALIVDNGKARVGLITLDAGAVSERVWERVSAQAAMDFGIPPTHLMITATHSHSAPAGAVERHVKGSLDALRRAFESRRPAHISYGTGQSYINVNRNIIDPKTRRWWEGVNREGPSDKTVAVMAVRSTDGQPIALYYNYAVHAVLLGQLDLISGDLPGAASAYIEDALGAGAVALWSEGAAGDQNPVYFQQTYDLREIRIREQAKKGNDISNAMPPGGQGLDRSDPQVMKLMRQQQQMALSMGQMLGEEVLYVIRNTLERPEANTQLLGAQSSLSCPGRRRTDTGRAGYPGSYVDAEAVPIRLSLLRIGDIAIGGVNAEVFNPIALRFKRESPLKRTMMATLTNGTAPSGYIPHDAAFTYHTFEVLSSRLKSGCAEAGIVDGLIDLLAQP
jgi:neutral ceramidase